MIQTLLLSTILLTSPLHAQKKLSQRGHFHGVCVNQMSQLEPEDLAQFPTSPAEFCRCVFARHLRWAEDQLQPQAHGGYIANIIALYEPTDARAFDRVAKEYAAEATNDRAVKRVCKSK